MTEELDIEQAYEELKKQYDALARELEEYRSAIQKAYLNPETREPLKKIMKDVAGVEIEDPVYEKAIKSEIEKIAKKVERIEEEKKNTELKKKQQELLSLFAEYGVSDKEMPQLAEFIKKTGVTPTTPEGWRVVLANYQRSKMARPTFIPETEKKVDSVKDWLANPEGKLREAFEKALYRR